VPLQSNRWVSLGSADLTAEINALGAELSVLRDRAGRDLLWDGDPSVWAGRAPLLFPIVGELAGGSYRLGSATYPLPRHGFARRKPFHIVESTLSGATFRLTADASTLPVYPFHFELDVRFALNGPTLSVTTQVRNVGDGDMPASLGYHPAFRWPLPFGRARSSHFIEFDRDQDAPIRRLNGDGLLASERHPTPVFNRRLALADSLFQDDVVIFDEVQSPSLSYGAEGAPRIRLSYPGTPYLGVWTKPRANFICIEPWHGVSDPEGFAEDFRTKPGVFMVPPGGAVPIEMTITLSGF
jgi:galactose mutarotase-like enzyme